MAFFTDVNYLKPEKGPLLKDIDAIYQSIYSVFGTKPGTRLFRPTWGGNLSRYLYEPCDILTARSMMYDIRETLRYEPRVELNNSKSSVTPDPANHQFLIVLTFATPGFSDYESTISLTFQQE